MVIREVLSPFWRRMPVSYILWVSVSGEDDLDILTSLLVENEETQDEETQDEETQQGGCAEVDDLDGLFDNDDEEDYDEGLDENAGAGAQHGASALFGDVSDLEEDREEGRLEEDREEGRLGEPGGSAPRETEDRSDKSKQDLEGTGIARLRL